MQKNKLTIIIYLLIILVLVFPAARAIAERQVYAHAPAQQSILADKLQQVVAATASPTTGAAELAAAEGTLPSPTVSDEEDATPTPSDTTGPGDHTAQPETGEPTEQREPPNTGVVPDDPAELATPTYPIPDEPVEEETPAGTPQPTQTRAPTQAYTGVPSSQWKEWPVLPESLNPELIEIYRQGIAQGNNEHAFSVLGDCQSIPDVFMGIYDHDGEFVSTLPQTLQDTIHNFGGSFERYSPTVKDGTTEGALLWYGWNDNLAGQCEHGESPIDCELRVHKPTIVFLHTGTHWEARSRDYLVRIINKVKDAKAIPVIVTKADNRELDGHVNQTLADLAVEFNLPVWNFWASVQHLPEHGMEPGSDMYLSEDGLDIHRQGGLDALDAIWRMAEGGQ